MSWTLVFCPWFSWFSGLWAWIGITTDPPGHPDYREQRVGLLSLHDLVSQVLVINLLCLHVSCWFFSLEDPSAASAALLVVSVLEIKKCSFLLFEV